jgi:GNAT superfamily N-acetyltransferase
VIRYAVEFLDEGVPGAAHEVATLAAHEFPEMHWQCSIPEATKRLIHDTNSNTRAEITARDPSGTLVGFVVLAEDEDSHVGELLGVQWFYVLPEYRGEVGRKLMRVILKVARATGYEVLAYTHRLSEGRYEINYRRLSNG